jgi:hypothetical protein
MARWLPSGGRREGADRPSDCGGHRGSREASGRAQLVREPSFFGKRIVITRSREQAGQLRAKLHDLGAHVLEIPTIRFEAPTNRQLSWMPCWN